MYDNQKRLRSHLHVSYQHIPQNSEELWNKEKKLRNALKFPYLGGTLQFAEVNNSWINEKVIFAQIKSKYALNSTCVEILQIFHGQNTIFSFELTYTKKSNPLIIHQ